MKDPALSSSANQVPDGPRDYDPVYLHARREAVVIILLFATFCIWSLAVSWTQGYKSGGLDGESIKTILGMPTWAFWGVFVPWLVVDVVAVWFCFCFMKNDDLGEAHEGEDLAEQIQHMEEEEATDA